MIASTPMMISRPLISTSPTKKTQMTKWLKKPKPKNAMRVHLRLPALLRRERRHHLVARLAQQLATPGTNS